MRAKLFAQYGIMLVSIFCLVAVGIAVADFLLCSGGMISLVAEVTLAGLFVLFGWQHFHAPVDKRHTGDGLIIALSCAWMCIEMGCFAADLLQKMRIASLPFNAAVLALLFCVLFFSEAQDLVRRWCGVPASQTPHSSRHP